MKTRTELQAHEGYRLLGTAFEVYNQQGHGLSEEIYQECMEIELELRRIPFRAKPPLDCWYKGRKLARRYVPDLLVDDGLIVELKSASSLHEDHQAQLLNYLRLARKPVGYLVNFGQKDGVQWKRMILSEFAPISEDLRGSAVDGS